MERLTSGKGVSVVVERLRVRMTPQLGFLSDSNLLLRPSLRSSPISLFPCLPILPVNNDLRAQYTLHTKNGCTQSNNTAFPYDSASNVVSTNCDYKVNGNQGCQFRENSTAS